MGGRVYLISVSLTALFLFWPVLYGNIELLQRIPGNPTLQALVGVLIFGSAAYISYDEDGEDTGEENLTAS